MKILQNFKREKTITLDGKKLRVKWPIQLKRARKEERHSKDETSTKRQTLTQTESDLVSTTKIDNQSIAAGSVDSAAVDGAPNNDGPVESNAEAPVEPETATNISYSCLDCQEQDFGGWPVELKEYPVNFSTVEHRNTMKDLCTGQYSIAMPNFPINENGDFANDIDLGEQVSTETTHATVEGNAQGANVNSQSQAVDSPTCESTGCCSGASRPNFVPDDILNSASGTPLDSNSSYPSHSISPSNSSNETAFPSPSESSSAEQKSKRAAALKLLHSGEDIPIHLLDMLNSQDRASHEKAMKIVNEEMFFVNALKRV